MLANHGRISKYDHEFEGVNSRLDGLQAAILSVKLKSLAAWTESRRAIAERYTAALAGRDGILAVPSEAPTAYAVYHLYVVRVRQERREAIQAHLAALGVSTGIHYPIPLPLLRAYRHLGHEASQFPIAVAAASEILSLPIFPEMTREQTDIVVRELTCAAG
jgi:dTDP-4-amino-4,6-dideoxygalactose transaminase